MHHARKPDLPETGRARPRPLTAHEQSLAEGCVKLAKKLAKPFKLRNPGHWEDYESDSRFALVRAAQSYDPQNPAQATFATYASNGVRQHLLNARSKLMRVDKWETNWPDRYDASALQPPVGADVDEGDALDRYLRNLPPKPAELCRRIYAHGQDQQDAGRALGLTKFQAFHMHKKALSILRQALAGKETDR